MPDDITEVMLDVDGTAPPGAGKAKRPVGKWLLRTSYDPEKEYAAESYNTAAPTYAKRFALVNADKVGDDKIKEAQKQKENSLQVQVPGYGGPFIPIEIEGTMLVPTRESRRWKPVEIENKKVWTQFNESARGRDKKVVESFGLDYGDTFGGGMQDSTRLLDEEFIPIMGGPFSKQLYIYDYLYMHARAFQMVNHSALASAAIKIMQRFVLGRGLTFHIKHAQAREVWNEFWKRNKMHVRMRQMARDLPWQGELMMRIYEKSRGYVSMRVLDPSTCWEVVTDPEDIDHVYYYHFQWPTPYQIWVTGQIPTSKYIIQQVPATNIIHLKINVSSQEKRGRSDLLAAMPWIKRFNDFYNGQSLKAILEANLVFKVKIKGDQQDVDSFLTNPALTELPPPGGIWIENEAVDLQATTAQMTSGRGSSGIGQELAAVIAASLNLPSEYLNIQGSGGGSARATALVRTDPAVKMIEDRQQLLRETCEEVYDFVMASALSAGRISKTAAREDPDARNDEQMDDDKELAPNVDMPVPGQRPVQQSILVRG